MHDLIIVGGGPAGMSAALYAKRQGIDFLLITETVGGLANYVPSLRSYLGYHYITGFKLVEKFKKHLDKEEVKVVNNRVKQISPKNGSFEMKTGNEVYSTKSMLITTGRKFRALGITGEEKFTGKGVSDCAACDGPLFKDKEVAVIGGGRSGLFATLFLLNIVKKIYLIEQDNTLKTQGGLNKISQLIKKNPKVEILLNTKPVEILGNTKADTLVIENGGNKRKLDLDGVFVEVGYDPNTEFIGDMLDTNDRGEIIIDEECRTSRLGIFAAGDVTQLKEKQVVVAVGEGAKAALAIALYLEQT